MFERDNLEEVKKKIKLLVKHISIFNTEIRFGEGRNFRTYILDCQSIISLYTGLRDTKLYRVSYIDARRDGRRPTDKEIKCIIVLISGSLDDLFGPYCVRREE